jgi:hypothetical protein
VQPSAAAPVSACRSRASISVSIISSRCTHAGGSHSRTARDGDADARAVRAHANGARA